MTDAAIATITTQLCTLAGVIATSIFAFLSNKKSKANGKKADEINAKSDQIHLLVNNAMDVVLKRVVDLAEWKATNTGKPEDIEAAVEAAKVVAERLTVRLATAREKAMIEENVRETNRAANKNRE